MSPPKMSPSTKIGAFFDLDGTLLPAPSLEWRFISYLLAHDELSGANIARWFARLLNTILRDPAEAVEGNKSYLAGLRESLVADWGDSLTPDSLPFFAGGLERLHWHLARQHHVYFVSGTLEPLIRIVTRLLPESIEICASKLEICEGNWTGFLAGEHMRGEAKARAIRAVSAEHDLDLARSFAYGDAITDLPMLDAVGHPVAVNPSLRLERVAQLRGWPIQNWRKLQGATLGEQRNVGPQFVLQRVIR